MADQNSNTGYPVRIEPLDYADFSEHQKELVGGWHHLNFSKVLIRHPGMYGTYVPWLAEAITKTTLPPRDREIVCLRLLRMIDEVYEHTHHVTIAQRCGMTDEEIRDASAGDGPALTRFDRTVARATEELVRSQCISDGTWAELRAVYSETQAMELVFLAGCYLTLAMTTKTFGIQLEPDPETHEQVNALRTYT
jgi:alkylhydroperoxidase family enzyme